MNKFGFNKLLLSSSFAVVFMMAVSCKEKKDTTKSKSANQTVQNVNYDLAKPEKFDMPDALLEISGIAFKNGNPKEAFAIQDEEGLIFKFALGDKAIKGVSFASKGDYEDVSLSKKYTVVLKSNGALYTFPTANIGSTDVANVQEFKGLIPKAEYEGLFVDSVSNKVYVLNKQSKETKETPIFILNIDDQGVVKTDTQIELLNADIEKFVEEKKVKFRPSALAKNQISKEWYILSSINKMIVVTDENFKIKSVISLDGSLFNQPEGIAFDSEQNLYISNEGGDLGQGNILKFKYQK